MVDTVRVVSPALSEGDIERVERACGVRRSAVLVGTGEEQWSFTTGELLGSWDHRTALKVERERWESVELPRLPGERRRVHTRLVPCPPRVVLEASVHKAMLGHNVWGGPCDPVAAVRWFVLAASSRLGLTLPPGDDWILTRIDWAEAFDLGSEEACREYVAGLNAAQFPRRRVNRYGDQSLSAAGSTTTVKCYHKGPEFEAHDRKRFRKTGMPEEAIAALWARAQCTLRFETSIKSRKLSEMYEGEPVAGKVSRDDLESVHDAELGKLLSEAAHEVETVRTHQEVNRRLIARYGSIEADGRIVATSLSNTLFGVWMQLAALGEAEVRRHVARRTFFRHKAQLKEAGVSWDAADVQVVPKHSAIPAGFSPVRRDSRRLVEEAPEVLEALASVR